MESRADATPDRWHSFRCWEAHRIRDTASKLRRDRARGTRTRIAFSPRRMICPTERCRPAPKPVIGPIPFRQENMRCAQSKSAAAKHEVWLLAYPAIGSRAKKPDDSSVLPLQFLVVRLRSSAGSKNFRNIPVGIICQLSEKL